ncbi:MAG: thiamine phosphate synthase [Clostridia bacterium]|nr:thiamine phosphate synthase [Clostridia bacterium]
MKFDKKQMLLYAVTDRTWTGEETLLEQVRHTLDGGITCLQLREKNMCNDELIQEAKEVKKLCNEYAVPFIINDYVNVARLIDADGVHVGQADMNAADVRAYVGQDKILGVSVQTIEQAIKAEQSGADYLGVGAMFGTNTKPDAVDVSLLELQEICAAVKIPVIAIGGINIDNVSLLKDTGICGVAVISALYAKKDIEQATKDMRKQLELSLGDI